MRFVIITGMSGAGKSTTLKFLEDAGYYCVDNMPIALITKFADLANTQQSDITKVAVGVDIRSGESLPELESVLEQFKAKSFPCEILFLEATDEVLVKRYKETRRAHPLAGADRVDKGISEERKKLEFLKKQADYILDTSQLLTRELKIEIEKIFVNNEQFNSLYVTILSFGFKYGIPSDSDLVFDVRFLPNPYYIPELKALTGNDKAIQDYVMGFDAAHEFLNKLTDMVNFLIPNYIAEGKNRLVISIGCTGGKHRSVTLANELYRQLSDKDYGLKVEHRDILKDSLRKK
ncbi:MAG: RNase adapter RapZ [Lachnospiraceae bacterium]|uniref:RNase adapter RapZ n=1 Tax=Falcatimonas sp. MSJ-15 TaxID=2841515 RepID=UPI001C11E8FD|nr:RNase adapter RapZ [Falcatimonas sp. MSJ-15]MBQ5733923.1 RNase adapter RapZ [Lachnospiraceae bacterium]MBU5470010.1 RNase adapter RapZ [Falcatimonas sp. MSJ-15]MEE0960593.1 RNase adapter RapZ [Lachnospiraceae bacterium]